MSKDKVETVTLWLTAGGWSERHNANSGHGKLFVSAEKLREAFAERDALRTALAAAQQVATWAVSPEELAAASDVVAESFGGGQGAGIRRCIELMDAHDKSQNTFGCGTAMADLVSLRLLGIDREGNRNV